MKFPLNILHRSLVSHAFVLLALLVALTLTTVAQKSDGGAIVPEADAADLDQCRNGDPPEQCTGNNWVNGNVGSQNSHYAERDFIAYRMKFTGLSAGPNVVVIGYDRIHSGKNAIDYLGDFNYTETDADPCSGVTGVNYTCVTALWKDYELAPLEPELASHVPPIPQIPGGFTLWGATFDSAPVFIPCGTSDDTLVRCVQITFTPNAGVTNPVLAWGGHIAWRGEWGANQSAGGISGSPYHMRLISLNGSGGNQDRSLSADAVFGPGSLRIIKSVTTDPFGTSSTVAFFFTSTSNFGVTSFSLVDDDAGPGTAEILSAPILSFNGTANRIDVTERVDLFPANQNWSLNGNPVCTESVSSTGTNNITNGKSVLVDPEEVVVCTFNNTQLAPSAAHASIDGRVVDSFGNGIGGSRITVMDAQTGELRFATTNPFGYYTVSDLEVGSFYVVTVAHKRYTFADDTRTLTLDGDFSGMDFIANPME